MTSWSSHHPLPDQEIYDGMFHLFLLLLGKLELAAGHGNKFCSNGYALRHGVRRSHQLLQGLVRSLILTMALEMSNLVFYRSE